MVPVNKTLPFNVSVMEVPLTATALPNWRNPEREKRQREPEMTRAVRLHEGLLVGIEATRAHVVMNRIADSLPVRHRSLEA